MGVLNISIQTKASCELEKDSRTIDSTHFVYFASRLGRLCIVLLDSRLKEYVL